MIPTTSPATARPLIQAVAASLGPSTGGSASGERQSPKVHCGLRTEVARGECSMHAAAGAPDAKQ